MILGRTNYNAQFSTLRLNTKIRVRYIVHPYTKLIFLIAFISSIICSIKGVFNSLQKRLFHSFLIDFWGVGGGIKTWWFVVRMQNKYF